MFQLGPVKDYVKMLSENVDVKFIVFAHHRVMLDCITELLVNDNVAFIRIDGSTLAVDRPVFLTIITSCYFDGSTLAVDRPVFFTIITSCYFDGSTLAVDRPVFLTIITSCYFDSVGGANCTASGL